MTRWRSLLIVTVLLSAAAGCSTPDPDSDGDGYPLSQDCNDGDASVHPFAVDLCYDGIDQDCKDGDRIDCDGDGQKPGAYGGEDCNDDDPGVYSGAAELPYDGIDQDCSGDDLVDQDGDGFAGIAAGGGDCNDTLDTVYPGADEIAYNGVDEDCVDGDLTDVDGDGQDAALVGGSDCDDHDALIYLGATEVPYDGVDQDCDEEDLVDVDGDGFTVSEDCDDNDAARYPGAAEVAYNNIDEDCDGADLVDVDHDGFLPASSGGGDCDDNDASINPAAQDVTCNAVDENCDGVAADQDCDGHLPAALGGDDCDDSSSVVNPGIVEVSCNALDENCDGLLSDRDCDGEESVALGGHDCDDNDAARHSGALELVDGLDNNCNGDVDEAQLIEEASALVSGVEADLAGATTAMGDVNGDGIVDMAVGAPGDGSTPGSVFLVLGSRDELGDIDLHSAPYVIYGWEAGDLFGTSLALGDVDGDGIDDIIAGAPHADDVKGDAGNEQTQAHPGRVYVFLGGSLGWGPRTRVDSASFVLTGAVNGDDFGRSVAALGDIDGDQIGDLAVGAPGVLNKSMPGAGAAYIFRGAAAVDTYREASQADAILLGDSMHAMAGSYVAALGDLNHDSLQDVGIGSPGRDGGTGQVAVFFGSSDLTGWSLSSPSLSLTADEGGGLGTMARAGDLNSDGIDDLLVGAPMAGSDNRGKVYLLSGSEDLRPGAYDLSTDNDGVFYGETGGDAFGSTLASGYLDGDEYPDVLIGSANHASGEGKVYLFTGGNEGWGTRLATAWNAVWVGAFAGQAVGASLTLGDLNDDGAADLAIGAPGDATGGTQAGAVFMFLWR